MVLPRISVTFYLLLHGSPQDFWYILLVSCMVHPRITVTIYLLLAWFSLEFLLLSYLLVTCMVLPRISCPLLFASICYLLGSPQDTCYLFVTCSYFSPGFLFFLNCYLHGSPQDFFCLLLGFMVSLSLLWFLSHIYWGYLQIFIMKEKSLQGPGIWMAAGARILMFVICTRFISLSQFMYHEVCPCHIRQTLDYFRQKYCP
jgi:hypothetical protein